MDRSGYEDGGALLAALDGLVPSDDGLVPSDDGPQGLVPLGRRDSERLWDIFVSGGGRAARHGMLLPRTAWPCAVRGEALVRPFGARLRTATWWVVFWMRERAALVRGAAMEEHLDTILEVDDEAVIALNPETLDSLQSWGGSRRWVVSRRPR